MFYLKMLFLISIFFTCAVSAEATKLVYVPMDDRPVCLSYTVDTLKKAGWEIVVPPKDIIASRYRKGEPDKLLDWLDKECKDAYAAVISSDAVIYGGLVASRTHDDEFHMLSERRERLSALKKRSLGTKIYVFSTIMRTPKMSSGGVEPPYYEKWGTDIFRKSVLFDKDSIMGLSKAERQEFDMLEQKIPQDVSDDWMKRRMTNLGINIELLDSTVEGDFDYFVLGKDDTAPFSQSHMEARYIKEAIKKKLVFNFKMFVGADQLGMLLLTRAVNERNDALPFVYPVYAEGKGAKTVPSYEDVATGETVKDHILAAGGAIVKRADNAELVLMLNTPYDGITKEASSEDNVYQADKHIEDFTDKIIKATLKNKVAVADVQFGNGASNALAKQLIDRNISASLASYAGWNTASNSIGYAIGQGILSSHMKREDSQELLMVRFYDDWTYQANIRGALYKEVLWPKGINGVSLGKNKPMLEKEALTRIKKFSGSHVPQQIIDRIKVEFPWDRMFEINIMFK